MRKGLQLRLDTTSARLFAALAVLFAFACASPRAAAQGSADDEREQFEHGFEGVRGTTWHLPSGTTKAEAAALGARWKALGEELKTTADEFAGTYRAEGPMRGSFLRWAPGGGFVYLYVYEHFSVLDFSYGKVEVTPTALVFTVEREQRGDKPDPPRPTPRRWVAARWRTTNYLIPEKDVANFGLYVGGFGQYNDFNGPCCEFAPFMSSEPRRDPQKSFEEPLVPAPYARLMRSPVEATITAVGRKRVVKDYGMDGELYGQSFGKASLTPVTINAGRGRGLKPGLLLRLVGEPEGQYLKLTRVLASRSEGVVIRQVYDDGESYSEFPTGGGEPQRKIYPPVKVGTRVTSAPITY